MSRFPQLLILRVISLSKLPESTVAKFCDAIRLKLEEVDLTKYVNSILTAHVVKNPPDLEAALNLLLTLRGRHLFIAVHLSVFNYTCAFSDKNTELVQDAVKYMIFLVDVDKLFDAALGMYDFTLVLLIAQHSQRVIQILHCVIV